MKRITSSSDSASDARHFFGRRRHFTQKSFSSYQHKKGNQTTQNKTKKNTKQQTWLPSIMPDDGYDTSLFDLAVAARLNRSRSPVAPTDEAATLVDEAATLVDKHPAQFGNPAPAAQNPSKERKQRTTEKRTRHEANQPSSPEYELQTTASEKRKKLGLGNYELSSQDVLYLKMSFVYVMAQFQRLHPDDDKEGRFAMAQYFSDALMQYMEEDCPADSKWNDDFALRMIATLKQQQRTTRSDNEDESVSTHQSVVDEASSVVDEASSTTPLHRLTHLPKKRKFSGAQLVESKCNYPQFACKGKCGRRVRTYCCCSPGIILCCGCFVRHTVEKEAETALKAAE